MKNLIKILSLLFFLTSCDATSSNRIEWALLESPLLVSVGKQDYQGDNLDPGNYKAELKSFSPRNAEIFDIVVSNRELTTNEVISIIRDQYSESYRSNVKVNYSHYSVGGMGAKLVNIRLNEGQFVHIIPNTYYSKKRGLGDNREASGILSISMIGN
jgi:hypothetical protein